MSRKWELWRKPAASDNISPLWKRTLARKSASLDLEWVEYLVQLASWTPKLWLIFFLAMALSLCWGKLSVWKISLVATSLFYSQNTRKQTVEKRGKYGACLQRAHPHLVEETERDSSLVKTIRSSVIKHAWGLLSTPRRPTQIPARWHWFADPSWYQLEAHKLPSQVT